MQNAYADATNVITGKLCLDIDATQLKRSVAYSWSPAVLTLRMVYAQGRSLQKVIVTFTTSPAEQIVSNARTIESAIDTVRSPSLNCPTGIVILPAMVAQIGFPILKLWGRRSRLCAGTRHKVLLMNLHPSQADSHLRPSPLGSESAALWRHCFPC
jgi:hypothetical protein